MKNASPRALEKKQKKTTALARLKAQVLGTLLGGSDSAYYERRKKFLPNLINRVVSGGRRLDIARPSGYNRNKVRRLETWKLHCDQCNRAAALRREERKRFGHVITVR